MLYDDFLNPQPTNVFLTTQLRPFTVTVDSRLPYSFGGPGRLSGITSLLKTNSGSLTIGTSNDFTGGTVLAGGTLVISNDAALGAAAGNLVMNGDGLQILGNTTSTRPIALNADLPLLVGAGITAQFGGIFSGGAATGTVEVGIRSTGGFSGNMLPTVSLAGGQLQVRFLGVPSRTYTVQRATQLPGTWTTLGTTRTSAGGLGMIVDANPPAGKAFYRTVYP